MVRETLETGAIPASRLRLKRPLRICFFNRSYYPDMGATGQLLTELAEGLVRDFGCEVSVIAGAPLVRGEGRKRPSAGGWKLVRRERHNGVEIYRASGTTFRPGSFLRRVTNYLSYFLSACLAGLRIPRQDVVVSLTDPPIIGLAALLTARRSRARYVFLCEDVFPEVATLLEDFRNETVNWILDWINRFLLRKADRVIALGDTMRQRLIVKKDADPDCVSVIHNWADCASIVPGPKENPFSVSNGLAGKFVVMHSGNMGLSQSLGTLLEAARRLRPYEEIVVAMVGDGVKRASLEEKARSEGLTNVRFFPYQPKERLRESFASADMFVVSLMPGLAGYIVPSKLYGILAAGRPYVAAVEDDSEVAAITREFDCGLLAEPEDPDDLARKVLTLYSDRDLARRLGANARRAASRFDRPVQVRAYHDLFREMSRAGRVGSSRVLWLKRLFDVALSGVGLLLSAPLWGVIVLAIKWEDGGPVFYSQERVGKDGKIFRAWKFRSMVPDAEKGLGPVQSHEGDLRVTRIGGILRATAMDELPQLYNIFRGDMSFVGPRAIRPGEKEVRGDGSVVEVEEIPGGLERQSVIPGLTGLAQIFGDHDTPRRHKFRYDLLYIEKQSFWLDIKLVFLSFWITFRGKWESREKKI